MCGMVATGDGMAEKQTIGNAELWLGDAGEVLPLLGDFDLLLTDPPYGLGEKLQGGTWGENNAWDQTPVDGLLLDVARAHCTKQIIWGGNYYALPPTRGWLTWFKPVTAHASLLARVRLALLARARL